jgi:hypothetical protein
VEFLEGLPPSVTLGESAPAADAPLGGIPAGGPVDPASVERHRAALALRQAQPELSYAEALRRACAARAF